MQVLWSRCRPGGWSDRAPHPGSLLVQEKGICRGSFSLPSYPGLPGRGGAAPDGACPCFPWPRPGSLPGRGSLRVVPGQEVDPGHGDLLTETVCGEPVSREPKSMKSDWNV